MNKLRQPHWCTMGYKNNWRKRHGYAMRRKYKKSYIDACKRLRENGMCELPFC